MTEEGTVWTAPAVPLGDVADECWGCGCATHGQDPCPECAASTAVPQRVDSRRSGSIVFVKGFRSKTAVLVEDGTDGTCLIADQRGRASTAKASSVTVRSTPNAPGRPPLSPGGAMLAAEWDRKVSGWGFRPSVLRKIATQWAGEDLKRVRLLALDCLNYGQGDLLDALPLTTSERHLLTARVSVAESRWKDALDHLAKLPGDRYRSTTPLVAACLGRTDVDERTAAGLVAVLKLRASDDQLAALCLAALGDPAHLQPSDGALGAVGFRGAAAAHLAIRAGGLPDPESTPDTPSMRAYLAIQGQEDVDIDAATLVDLKPAELDDLIDAGRIHRDHVPALRTLPAPLGSTAIARIDPGLLSDDEVDALGLREEQARRSVARGEAGAAKAFADVTVVEASAAADRYLAGDDNALEQITGAFPDDAVRSLQEARRIADSAEGLPGENDLDRPYVARAVLARLAPEDLLTAPAGGLQPLQERLLGAYGLQLALEHLWSGDWDTAEATARHVLRVCLREQQDDEALNVIAAAQLLRGDTLPAMQSLDKALQGAYTMNLVINAAIIARRLEPRMAATHLAELITHAPTLDMKVAAAHEGIRLWLDNLADFNPFGQHEMNDIPEVLATPLRQLVVEPIPLDTFREFLQLMARSDSEWLARQGALRSSPHSASVEAGFYQARARGFDAELDALIEYSSHFASTEWLRTERDTDLRMMVHFLLTTEEALGVGIMAYKLVDARLPMSEAHRVMLTALAAQEHVLYWRRTHPEPTTRLNDRRMSELAQACRTSLRLTGDDAELAAQVVRGATSVVQVHLLSALEAQFQESLQPLLNCYYQSQVQAAIPHALSTANMCLREVRQLLPYVSPEAALATAEFTAEVNRRISYLR